MDGFGLNIIIFLIKKYLPNLQRNAKDIWRNVTSNSGNFKICIAVNWNGQDSFFES